MFEKEWAAWNEANAAAMAAAKAWRSARDTLLHATAEEKPAAVKAEKAAWETTIATFKKAAKAGRDVAELEFVEATKVKNERK